MFLDNFLFSFFYFFVILCSIMTISARNPVHSVLFLILVFFNAAGVLFTLGTEFLALVLLVVYVGAIAVLFLFVVMMLDVRVLDLRRDFLLYFPVGSFLVVAFTFFLSPYYFPSSPPLNFYIFFSLFPDSSNSQLLGYLLYTYHFPNFILSGFILFVAMVGAILLTLSKPTPRCRIVSQVFRSNRMTFVIKELNSASKL